MSTSSKTDNGPADSLMGRDARKMWLAASRVSYIGIFFGVAICIGYFGGRWLDGRLHTAPWLSLFGLLLGIATGFRELIRIAQRLTRDAERDEQDEANRESNRNTNRDTNRNNQKDPS